MGKFNLLGADQDELLDLWERSRLEYDAANALLLTSDCGQGRSVALHLFRGWYALATMFARRSGVPEPVMESLTIERGSSLLAPLSSRTLSDWESSFESIRNAALEGSWLTGVPEADERHLSSQARMLGRCLKAHRPRVARAPWRSRLRQVGWRSVLTAIAVLVLVVAAFDLGVRLWVSLHPAAGTGDTTSTIPENVYLTLEQLSEPKQRGHTWNGPGTVNFTNRVVVSLGGVVHTKALSVSLDGNDFYRISWMAGDEMVGVVTIEPARVEGLEIYSVATPNEAVFLGFDSIVIEIDRGDGYYSIGHLLLDPITNGSPDSGEVPG